MTDDTQKLEAPEETDSLESGEDLALSALAQANGQVTSTGDEVQDSDNVADTLSHLQSILERYAMELERISAELKEKRESLNSIFENDQELGQAQEEAKAYSVQAKERKGKLQSSPVATGLKSQIGELGEQKKEVEETISNHLLNYYSLTNSKSFDTSDGDQWDFDIRAKVKSRKK